MTEKQKTIAVARALLPIAAGAFAYVLLLLIPPPPFVVELVYRASWEILVALLLGLALVFRGRGAAREMLQSVAVLALFAIPLLFKWQFAAYDGSIVGGLLPWSDASGYFSGAMRLIDGLPLTVWSARRPLFSCYLSSALRLTGGSLTGALALFAFLNGVAVLLAARAANRCFGAAGVAIYVVIAFRFYSRFAGTTLTEQLGFALGNLAVFFFLTAVSRRSSNFALAGLGLLTIGLNARAGAFFILPALVIWIAFEFGRRGSALWRMAALAFAVVAAGFVVNLALVKSLSDGKGVAFSNYSYTLYGIASGNKGWDLFLKEHPTAKESEVMSLAVEKIRANPRQFANGMIDACADYFEHEMGSFTFVYSGSFLPRLNRILWFLVLLGVVHAALQRFAGAAGLSVASLAGVLASIPLLPPIDSDGMRVFATTIPFGALWVMGGVVAVGRLVRRSPPAAETLEDSSVLSEVPALLFASAILVMAIVLPVLAFAIAAIRGNGEPVATATPCRSDERTLRGFFMEDASVVLIPNGTARESVIPFVRIDDFRRSLAGGLYPFLDDELRTLDPGKHLSLGYLLSDGDRRDVLIWLISDGPVAEGDFTLCGRRLSNAALDPYCFYTARNAVLRTHRLELVQRQPSLVSGVRIVYALALIAAATWLLATLLDSRRLSIWSLLLAFFSIVLVGQAMVMSQYAKGRLLVNFKPQVVELPSTHFTQETGNAFLFQLGTKWMDQSRLGASPAVVREDGVPLGPPNSMHQDIRDRGKGSYSVWDGYLYFSSSDNSDPRTNGRKYSITWPQPVEDRWRRLSQALGLLGALVFFARATWVVVRQRYAERNSGRHELNHS